MKKRILLALCLLLLTGCAQSYDGPTEEKRVLSKVTSEWMPFGDWSSIPSRTEYAYDIYGNRARVMEYRENELTSETRSRFDEEGRVISSQYIDHTAWIPHTTCRETWEYDDQGRILEQSQWEGWFKLIYRTETVYDDLGGHTRTYTQSDGRTDITVHTVTRNEQGLVATSTYGGDITHYEYDEAGRLIKLVTADSVTCIVYDERGNEIHRETTSPEGTYVSDQTYDDQGRPLTARYWGTDGEIYNDTVYVYDDYGYTCTQTRRDGDSRQETYNSLGELLTVLDIGKDGQVHREEHYFYDTIEVPAQKEE